MGTHTSNTIVTEARGELATGRTVRLRISGIDEWLAITSLEIHKADVGTLIATLAEGERLVFRKEELIGAKMQGDRPAYSWDNN